MKKLIAVFVFMFATIMAFSQIDPDVIYVSGGSAAPTTFTVNPSTGLSIPIAPNSFFGPVTELQFDPTGSFLYGGTGGGASNLISIDPLTGIETLIGTHILGALNGLEFVGNTLYGTFFDGVSTTSLVIVNPVTAALTPIGVCLTNNTGTISGLAYDYANGVMYGMAHGFNNYPPVMLATLVTIDLATGNIAPIGEVMVSSQCRGLTFGPEGILYTGTPPASQVPGFLISLDKNTGMGTLIAPVPTISISGLAYPQPPQIPISNWAIIIGVFLIVASIAYRFKRRLA